jgi:8-oxo-dGTP pyrophosphatase MutT (NUDIX family)
MSRRDHLNELLREHDASDATEEGFRIRMLELLGKGDDCFARDHFAPGHFTASAFILNPDRTELLLILHAKLGLWLQPGGHVELDDADVLAAARREAKEEVGLTELQLLSTGLVDVDIHTIPAGREPAHLHFDVRFLFESPTVDLIAASDASDARWVPFQAVASHHSDASVMRALATIEARDDVTAPRADRL